LSVSISRQGEYIIASVMADLSDSQVAAFRADLLDRVGELRARGIIVDVSGLDVIDSYVARSLRSIALTARLRGAETVVVGIRPDVAIAMVQFDLDLDPIHAALDLDEAFSLLERWIQGKREDER
jgi:rsbT antagonist protein RsbS